MLSIYSGAYLTIAADHAENGEQGCFASSSNKPLRIRQIPLPETFQRLGKAFIDWGNGGDLHPDHSNFAEPHDYRSPLSIFQLVDGLCKSVFYPVA